LAAGIKVKNRQSFLLMSRKKKKKAKWRPYLCGALCERRMFLLLGLPRLSPFSQEKNFKRRGAQFPMLAAYLH